MARNFYYVKWLDFAQVKICTGQNLYSTPTGPVSWSKIVQHSCNRPSVQKLHNSPWDANQKPVYVYSMPLRGHIKPSVGTLSLGHIVALVTLKKSNTDKILINQSLAVV